MARKPTGPGEPVGTRQGTHSVLLVLGCGDLGPAGVQGTIMSKKAEVQWRYPQASIVGEARWSASEWTPQQW